MFTIQHYCFLFASIIIIPIALLLLKRTTQKTQMKILKGISVAIIVIHLSAVFVTFFSKTPTMANISSTIWPVFFCNVIMWLFFITFLFEKPLKVLYPILFNFAILGGGLTLLLPYFHEGSQSIFQWLIMRSYLTHFLMLFGGLFGYVTGIYKPKVKDIIPIMCAFVFLMIFGNITNALFINFKGYDPNSMYLNEGMFGLEALKGYYMTIYLSVFYFLLFFFIEKYKHYKENNRLYSVIRKNKL